MSAIQDENWDTLKQLLPEGWEEMAEEFGVIKRFRDFNSVETLLRVLFLHLVNGYSLRETAAVARQAGIADVSDVAILKKFKSCEHWFHKMATQMVDQSLTSRFEENEFNVKLIDGTRVCEKGKTGSTWTIHYCINMPSLSCDFFEITPLKGKGNGEGLGRFPLKKGDLAIADRGYCYESRIKIAMENGADVLIRLAPSSIRMLEIQGKRLDFNELVSSLLKPGDTAEKVVTLLTIPNKTFRLIAIRKTQEAFEKTCKKIKRAAQKGGVKNTKSSTIEYAKYVFLFTSCSSTKLSTERAIELYRSRWQIELVFKRFKSLAQLGHLPKKDPHAVRTWLYGKLLVSLLAERLAVMANSFSPWGVMDIYICNQK